jgi:hypothetical protein
MSADSEINLALAKKWTIGASRVAISLLKSYRSRLRFQAGLPRNSKLENSKRPIIGTTQNREAAVMDKHDQKNVEDLSRAWSTAREAVVHALKAMEAALSSTTYRRKQGHIYYEIRRDTPYVVHDTDTQSRSQIRFSYAPTR